MSILFFCSDPVASGTLPNHTLIDDLSGNVRYWYPSISEPLPPGPITRALYAFFAMHQLRLFFSSNNYMAATISDANGQCQHRSMIFPRYFRFPFMGSDDLQIGMTWTLPDARGRGLATEALKDIARRTAKPGRRLWYLTDETNGASIGVARRAGFTLVGKGRRLPRYGVKALGSYDIERCD